MNEIKPFPDSLLAKMEAACAKRLDGREQPNIFMSHNRDFVEAYYQHLEDLKRAKFWLGA